MQVGWLPGYFFLSCLKIKENMNKCTQQDLLELPSPQWATKHPLAQCPIATNQINKSFGGGGVAMGLAGVPVAYYGLFAIFATQKTTLLWLCYREISTSSQKPMTKTNQPEQQQLCSSWLLPCLLTQANPGEGWRSRISECLLFCGGWGDTHKDTQCSHPMVRKRGTYWVMHCWQCTGFLTLPLLNMDKEDHLQDHLDNLASLKARIIGRREDIKWLDGLKHFGERRD